MRMLRIFTAVFAVSFIAACGDLNIMGTEDDDEEEVVCHEDEYETCEPGFIGPNT